MLGSSTSLRGVLLGLVLERPGHGYELANRLVDRLGGTWLIVRKDIYRLLEELEEKQLLAVKEERKPHRRQALLVYHPTDLTADALTEWMTTLIPKEPTRVGIRAKVAVAREQDARSLLLALKEYERQCLKMLQLAHTATGVPSWQGLLFDCSRDAVDTQLRCEVEWARRTRLRIDEYLTRRR
jgi:DNA-binding PadR family transcriptional regulator